MPESKYDAFISYRRSDGASVARWLRRELGSYRAPKALREQFGRRLRVYLDTAYERGASDFYQDSIRPALLASRYLLVVATPDAVRRTGALDDWIQREVEDFTAGPNGRNVIVVRGAGEFDAPLPADLKDRFPNIEIVDLRGAGRFWFLNPARAGRLSSEKLKLIAPLLGIPHEEMPRLRQEEERLQQIRLGSTVGATLGVLVAVSGLSVMALQSRNEAARALEDSMFATGSMVLMSAGLAKGGDDQTARTRRLLINQGCDLVDKLRFSSGREPQIAELTTCGLERAWGREALKEDAEARRQFEEVIEIVTRHYQQRPRSDAALRLIEARQAYAEYLSRAKEASEAEAEYARLLDDARRLKEKHDRSPIARAEGEASGQLGDRFRLRGEHQKAGESYDAAGRAIDQAIKWDGESASEQTFAWLIRLHRLAGEQYLQINLVPEARERFNRALDVKPGTAAAGAPHVEFETAIVRAWIVDLEHRQGDREAATLAHAEATAGIQRILSAQSASSNLKAQAGRLKTWLDQQAARNLIK